MFRHSLFDIDFDSIEDIVINTFSPFEFSYR